MIVALKSMLWLKKPVEEEMPAVSVWKHIMQVPSYVQYLATGALISVVEFILFKEFYPFANFIHNDSFVYLKAAMDNDSINTYPIGYSKFLRLVSVFSKSDTFLVGLQYFLIMGALLVLMLTIFSFYNLSRPGKWILFCSVVFNPVYLYLANYISSDALFLALSLVWFTQLLWLLQRPGFNLILWNAVVLTMAFTVRYNAMFYPLCGAFVYMVMRYPVWKKVIGFSVSIILIGAFVHWTSLTYKAETGVYQFTPFTGWQLANNALSGYRYIRPEERKPVPQPYQALDKVVRNYFDSSRDLSTHPWETIDAGTVYMWLPGTPLQLFKEERFKSNSKVPEFTKWASVAPLYKEYGNLLIRKYSADFFKHYLWVNTQNYLMPPAEFLATYNMNKGSVPEIAKIWFDYRTQNINTASRNNQLNILNFYPASVMILNILFFLAVLVCIINPSLILNKQIKNVLWLVSIFSILNFGFSVFASPIALRFQLFPVTLMIFYLPVFWGSIYEKIILSKAGALQFRKEKVYQVASLNKELSV
jgi:hypothetical protein